MFRQQVCVPSCPKIRMDYGYRAYWSMIKYLIVIEPHVFLLCAPRSSWVALRQDCLAHRMPFRSTSDRSVPRIEPQVERQLVCVRKFRVLPFCSASAKSKFNIFVVSLNILNSYFHSPGLYRGTVNSSCLRKSTPATCSSGSREGVIVSERERNTSLVVSV